jgi:hypothetical protein
LRYAKAARPFDGQSPGKMSTERMPFGHQRGWRRKALDWRCQGDSQAMPWSARSSQTFMTR